MSNNLFGGLSGALSGLVGGLSKSGLVPKDTPEGKLLALQGDLNDMERQECELLQEIGRAAYENDPASWPQDARLKLVRENIASTKAALGEARREQEQAEAAKAAEDARGRCANCGHKNDDGMKFCQECGSPLGAPAKAFCTSCGAELSAGTRFCGECGARQGE